MIVVWGSINLDLIFPVNRLPAPGETVLGPTMRSAPGGKGANQAVAAARAGASVVMVGAVGTDAFADPALAALIAAGVDVTRVRRVPGPTGCAAICVDTRGENQIAVAAGANLAVRADWVEDALLVPGTTLLLQMECDPAETAALIRRARGRGCRVILNLAPPTPLPAEALRHLNVLVVNRAEGAWLGAHVHAGGDAAGLHVALGVTVVRTLGADGAEWAGPAGAGSVPAVPVEVVDTTGAGDCFVGTLAWQPGADGIGRSSIERAVAAASAACSAARALPGA